MDLEHLTGGVRDAVSVKRVFGEPYQVDGVTVIPVARAAGGGGGGTNPAADGGEGGGFGIAAVPSGVFVVKDGDVRFVPAVDLNAMATKAAMVALALVLVWGRASRARQRRKARERKYSG